MGYVICKNSLLEGAQCKKVACLFSAKQTVSFLMWVCFEGEADSSAGGWSESCISGRSSWVAPFIVRESTGEGSGGDTGSREQEVWLLGSCGRVGNRRS